MGFEYLEVTAEVGILATGRTPEEVFEEGARALFNLMVDIKAVRPQQTVDIQVSAEALDLLFADWLNKLIIEKDKRGLVFSEFRVRIEKAPGRPSTYRLWGQALGEPLDKKRHETGIEVKAATYNNLSFEKINEEYRVRCVLDV